MAAGVFVGVQLARLYLDDDAFPYGDLFLPDADESFAALEVEQVTIVVAVRGEFAARGDACQDNPDSIRQKPLAKDSGGDVCANGLPIDGRDVE